jgi:tetratricopeptide (TPR) repeat protein
MTETAAAIPGGERIGDFQILGKLGAGGMGVVYKATDLRLERTVALKFLPAELSVEEAEKESLAREAKAASALDHANIGVIHGLEETPDGRLFIVMGYYEGETLAHKIRRGPLPLKESLDIACQVARGLCEAHARHIVHRDIKPSNIIITERGVAKIVDFGLARVISSASSSQSMRTSGTAAYMSPEQTMGRSLDHRTDVWSLGVVLVEMVTGGRPFAGENITGMMWEILNKPPTATDNLPAALQSIVYRALAKDPSQRYASCEPMLEDLERLRTELSVGGGPRDVEVTASMSARDFADVVKNASQPTWTNSGTGAGTAGGVGTGQSKIRWWYVVAPVAGLVLAAASLLIPAVRERAAGFLMASGEERHIAVLPFDNIGNDPENAALAEGLMDSLTAELSNLGEGKKSLWVVPSSVVRHRNVDDPSAALRDLGATLVVKGSITRQGKDIQLTVSLIDTKNLRQIGSLVREDHAGDLATLQNEAVAGIARLMGLNTSAEMLRATGGGVAPEAYESYLTALGYVQRYDKPGNLDMAVQALQDAVKTDPRFALGYAELGEAYRLKYQLDQNPKWIDEAIANCNRASQLDDRLPATYVTLGKLHSQLGKNDLALQEFQHALQLDAHSADGLMGVAGAYERMGRIKEAEDGFRRAAALRPDYWDGYNSLGMFYDRQQRYPEALAQLNKVVEMTPDNAQAYSNLAAVYLDAGDPKMVPLAEEALKKSVQLNPSYPAYANLGALYYGQGRYPESAAMTEKALQLNDKDFEVWYNLLLCYRWMKDEGKAAAAAEKATQLLEAEARTKPQDAQVQSTLGVLYATQKKRDKAITHIDTALALAPADTHVLADAGEAYEALGDRAQALRYLHESLKTGTSLDDLKGRPQMQDVLSDPSFRSNGK